MADYTIAEQEYRGLKALGCLATMKVHIAHWTDDIAAGYLLREGIIHRIEIDEALQVVKLIRER